MSKKESARRKREKKEKGKFYARKPNRENHRHIWAKVYGKIPAGFEVHHINRVHSDNRIENLVALPDWYHAQIHNDMFGDRSLETTLYTREYLLKQYEYYKDVYIHHNELLREANNFLKGIKDKARQDAIFPKKQPRASKGWQILKEDRKNWKLSKSKGPSIFDQPNKPKGHVRDLGFDPEADLDDIIPRRKVSIPFTVSNP